MLGVPKKSIIEALINIHVIVHLKLSINGQLISYNKRSRQNPADPLTLFERLIQETIFAFYVLLTQQKVHIIIIDQLDFLVLLIIYLFVTTLSKASNYPNPIFWHTMLQKTDQCSQGRVS